MQPPPQDDHPPPPADPFAPIDGIDLPAYVQVCRALVRQAGGSPREVERVLTEHGLDLVRWELLRDSWSARIRGHEVIRAAFRNLYLAPDRAPPE